MWFRQSLAPVLAVALIGAPATAAGQSAGTQQDQHPPAERQQQDRQPGAEARHDVVRADRLIGQTVRDEQNERLGRINDLALNVEDKRIAYAVVSRGGAWGVGGDTVAVPWQQIQPDKTARVVRLQGQQLQQAREIDTGRTWPMNAGEGPVGTAGSAPEHGVLPMSRIVGMDVHSKQGERLGQIDDVAIERDGSLAYAVIAHGGFLGMGDNYVAIPWDRLTLDAERQGAVLDVSRQQFESARQFDYREAWPTRVDWPFGDTR